MNLDRAKSFVKKANQKIDIIVDALRNQKALLFILIVCLGRLIAAVATGAFWYIPDIVFISVIVVYCAVLLQRNEYLKNNRDMVCELMELMSKEGHPYGKEYILTMDPIQKKFLLFPNYRAMPRGDGLH